MTKAVLKDGQVLRLRPAAEQSLEKENLGVRAENERARALYQKFGFVEEGCKRRENKDRRGHYHNSVEMACFLSQDSDPWAHGRKEQGSA